MSELATTYGALLIGALVASGFSGIVAAQCIVYFKLSSEDRDTIKALVSFSWMVDIAHTLLIWAAMWTYIIERPVDHAHGDAIPVTIALSVLITAFLIFSTHCFFAYRIYTLSNRSWYWTAPVVVLAFGRCVFATATGGEMIRMPSYSNFAAHYRWLFSVALALASGVDVLVTFMLYVLLKKGKSLSLSLNHVIDSLIKYTFEINSLTTIATVASLVCWLRMDNTLIFLGIHFVVGKLYANSLLTTLNMRGSLRRNRAKSVSFNIGPLRSPPPQLHLMDSPGKEETNAVQVSVTKSVHYDN